MNKQEKLALVESALEEFYGDQQLAANLREAVLYSIHAGGKRIRPYLLLEVFGVFAGANHYSSCPGCCSS